ncbi:MAG: TraR/DksA family transcriptional regulator [Pikeienuella sp.]|uniref:TraR/DksA family transcriptional regulator n=1 Tax=Pikeienuella sp. TaxID=2831957 RepID=UPI0039196351
MSLATKMKPRLEARLAELGHRLEEVERELDQPMDPGFADRATEREGDEALEALGEAGLREARAIRAALGRIETGNYGICAACGEEIAVARLEAVPHAPLCAACAAKAA